MILSSITAAPDAARRRAFTLVELLVVIAIIGVLVALLLPAIQSAREAARRTQCINNLRQMAIAVLDFEQARGAFPPGSTSDTTNIGGPYSSTWSVDILPHLEQGALFALWDPRDDFSRPSNKRLRESFVATYLCPDDMETDKLHIPESGPGVSGTTIQWAPGSYRAMSGHSLGQNGDHYWDNPEFAKALHEAKMPAHWQGPLHTLARRPGTSRRFKPVELRAITDGTANTFLIGESHQLQSYRRTMWAYAYTSYNQSSAFFESRTLLNDYFECYLAGGGGEHTCKRAWGTFHPDGLLQFARCDGSVDAITVNIDMNVFVAGGTIQGAEAVSLP